MASVSKRPHTRADGTDGAKWTVRYYDEKGVRRSKGCTSKKEADAFKRKVEREIEDGTHTPDTETVTVKQAAAAFLADADQRFKAGQIGRSRLVTLTNIMNGRVVPLIGGMRMKDLTAPRIEELHRQLIVERGVSAATARTTIRDLTLFERFAKRRRFTRTTPIAEAYETLPRARRPVVRQFTREDIVTLLIAAETPRYKAKAYSKEMMSCLIHMAALCGMRLGEILGLTVENVDFHSRIIRVRHSLTQYDEHKDPKSEAGVRDLHMPDRVARLLDRWLQSRHVPNSRGLMFLSHKGTALTRAALHRTWRDTLAQAGLVDDGPARRFHALRHFFASNVVDYDVKLVPALSRSLGHASIATTMGVYVHGMRDGGLTPAIIDQTSGQFLALTDASRTHDSITHCIQG